MYKLLFISLFVSSGILFFSCSSPSEPMPFYHYMITVDSDLSKIYIGSALLDAKTTYPYTFWDQVESGELALRATILPISDTGYVLFKLFGDNGYGELNPTLKDSLKIITPADTSYVEFLGNASRDTMLVFTIE